MPDATKRCVGYTSDDGSYGRAPHVELDDVDHFSPGQTMCRACYRMFAIDWRVRRGGHQRRSLVEDVDDALAPYYDHDGERTTDPRCELGLCVDCLDDDLGAGQVPRVPILSTHDERYLLDPAYRGRVVEALRVAGVTLRPRPTIDDEESAVALTRREWRDLRSWMDTHGYAQAPGESVTTWRSRTEYVARAYDRVLAAIDPRHDDA